jgi:hypothetical protein
MLFSWKKPQIIDTASGNFRAGQFIGVEIDLGRRYGLCLPMSLDLA